MLPESVKNRFRFHAQTEELRQNVSRVAAGDRAAWFGAANATVPPDVPVGSSSCPSDATSLRSFRRHQSSPLRDSGTAPPRRLRTTPRTLTPWSRATPAQIRTVRWSSGRRRCVASPFFCCRVFHRRSVTTPSRKHLSRNAVQFVHTCSVLRVTLHNVVFLFLISNKFTNLLTYSCTSHTRTVVRECFKGDEASQRKRPKFDPSTHQNPFTDLHKNWQAWLRPGRHPACNIL